MNPEQFINALHHQGIELTESQVEQFSIYYQTLVEWNKKVNLTSLTEEEDVYLKHFYDSISAAFYHDFTKELHICDVGAGAGFPSIPLKICFPHLRITIVDSLNKRINFLNHLAAELKLTSVVFQHDRAESFGKIKEHRESFDIVIARAVARMSVLCELCLPLTKTNGVFIAMKGAQSNEEVTNAGKAIELLGGELDTVHSFTLPNENSERSIIVLNKKSETPNKFPRKPGTPSKDPIV